MKLSTLFYKCVNMDYLHIENSIDYATERIEKTLYIYFECSNGAMDWYNNLNFPVVPYEKINGFNWFAHRGFLSVWKIVKKHISNEIMDPSVDKIVTVGYSHGAAIAVLCHEYVWFNRPDLRDRIEGYGFGCPRVIWGIKTRKIDQRWENFTVVRNIDDIVTHLPPVILGYFHVGKMIEIGQRGKYSRIDAHRPENILFELKEYEKNKKAYTF